MARILPELLILHLTCHIGVSGCGSVPTVVSYDTTDGYTSPTHMRHPRIRTFLAVRLPKGDKHPVGRLALGLLAVRPGLPSIGSPGGRSAA